MGKRHNRLHRFRVNLDEPLDLQASLSMFARNGDDRIDRFDGQRLLRSTTIEGRVVGYRCLIEPGLLDAVTVEVEDEASAPTVKEHFRHSFVSPPPGFARLRRSDAVIDSLHKRYPGVRPVLQHDLLAALIRAISAQQVNLRWATTTRRRLVVEFGTRCQIGDEEVHAFDAVKLARASTEQIRALQFTNHKSRAIIAVAQAVSDGAIDRDLLLTLSDEDVIGRLTHLRGIGRWSAEWILSRTLGRPTVVGGDLGVRKAVGNMYLGGRLPAESEVRAITRHWGESSSVAQTLLLHDLVSHSN